jgi:hypothetical protein
MNENYKAWDKKKYYIKKLKKTFIIYQNRDYCKLER